MALLICCGLIVALILALRPGRRPLLVLVGAGYAENLAVPHNVWGLNALDRLNGLTRANNGILAFFKRSAYLSHSGPKNSPQMLRDGEGNGEKAWVEHSKSLIADAGKHAGPLILVMSLHGAADESSPYLLAEEARPGSRPLRIETILETLATIDPRTPKILILDPTAMNDDWSFGVIRNDFARKLEQVKIPPGKNIWVFCSSAPNQRSWIDERSGMTSFARSLSDGLAGKAGRVVGENITLGSLCHYVGLQTKNWAAAERNAIQTPLLLCDKGIVQLPDWAGRGPKKENPELIRKEAEGIELVRSIVAPDPAVDALTAKPATRSDALETAWSEARNLESRDPGDPSKVTRTPAAFAPLAWRTFRESIVRREQLRRHGYDALVARKALDLKPPTQLDDALKSLPRRIAEARRIALKNSRSATLAMPAAEGQGLVDPDAATRESVRKIIDPQEAEFEKKFQSAGIDPTAFSDAALLELGEGADVEALLVASERLDRLVPGVGLSPVEVRYLSVVRAGLPGKNPPRKDLLARSIRLRRRAERVAVCAGTGRDDYAYAEQAQPWIRAAVDKADRARRSGEDLLFSTRSADHTDADGLFRQAEAAYDLAEARAETIRAALTLRDAVKADLPFLTHWTARRHPSADATDDSLTRLATLWDDVRKLGDLLERGPTDDLTPIDAQGPKVREGFVAVWRAYDNVVNGPKRDNRLDPRQDELAREVPITDRSQFRPGDDPPASRAQSPKIPEADFAKRANEQARGQALLALAAQGDDLFARANNLDTSETTLKRFPKNVEPPDLTLALDELGPRIRKCIGWIPEHVNELARIIPTLASPIGGELAPGLIRAERLVAFMEPSPAPFKAGEPDPVLMARRRRLYDLLVRQAERAWADHDWASGKAAYPSAVEAYLADAAILGGELLGPSDWSKSGEAVLAARRDALTRIDGLELTPTTPTPVWTSEPRFPLIYRLSTQPATDVPTLEGHPVAWIIGGGGSAFNPVGEPGARMPLRLDGESAGAGRNYEVVLRSDEHEASEKVPPLRPGRTRADLATRLFFRGREVSGKTPIEMHYLPELTVAADRGSDLGGLLVRADEEFGGRDTAIAIVFDNSESMGYQVVGEDKQKYDVAVDVLRDVVDEIVLKKETRVSLWTYGMRGNRNNAPPDSVQQLVSIPNWDPRTSPAELIRPLKEDPTSWGKTPLFVCMRNARADLIESGRKRKLLIVLTDGADSFQIGGKLSAAIRGEFQDGDVTVNIVLFQTDFPASTKLIPEYVRREREARAPVNHTEADYKSWLEEQFRSEAEAKDQLKLAVETIPKGSFVAAERRGELKGSLENFLAQRPGYRLTDGERRDVPNAGAPRRVEPRDADPSTATKLPPGDYNVFITDWGPWSSVKSGQTLILEVSSEGRGYLLQRGLLSDRPTTVGPVAETTELPKWRLATARGEPDRRTGAAFEVVLEDVSRRGARPLRNAQVIEQITPKAVWFDLQPPGQAEVAPFHIEVRALADRAAPSWGIYLPSPPRGAAFGDQSPRLTAWWSEDREMPSRRLNSETLSPGAKLDDAGTVLEFIGVETHFVASAPGAEPKPAECLAIRLKHRPNQRVRIERIELPGPAPAHEEHRFYRSADRVTALYWPVSPERFAALAAVHLSAIDPFVKDAKRLTLKVNPALLGSARKPNP